MLRRFIVWLNQKTRQRNNDDTDQNVYERERIRHQEKVELEQRLEQVKAQLLAMSPRKQDVSQ